MTFREKKNQVYPEEKLTEIPQYYVTDYKQIYVQQQTYILFFFISTQRNFLTLIKLSTTTRWHVSVDLLRSRSYIAFDHIQYFFFLLLYKWCLSYVLHESQSDEHFTAEFWQIHTIYTRDKVLRTCSRLYIRFWKQFIIDNPRPFLGIPHQLLSCLISWLTSDHQIDFFCYFIVIV